MKAQIGGATRPSLGSASFVTPEGGIAVYLRNDTGAASVKGEVVAASDQGDFGFITETTMYDGIGVVYEGGVAPGRPTAVVILGAVDVLLKDTTAATAGNWVKQADTDGRAEATQPPAGLGALAAAEHFKEMGHCLQTVSAGTDVLCRVAIHWN